jgi:hypothetical protein
MKSHSIDSGTKVSSGALFQFNQLQPEIMTMFTHAPRFGITSLEIHFLDGEIRRIVRHREESVAFAKGESK